MINIAHPNRPVLNRIYGPLPYGVPMPEPPLEPGMEVIFQSNGAQQRTLVERVEFEKHTGRNREWKSYPPNSKHPLDTTLEFRASWPEAGPQPYFRKGYECYIPDIGGNLIRYRVLAQSSLSETAHVFLVNVYGGLFSQFMIYEISLLQLRKMLDSKQQAGRILNPEGQAAPVRKHRRTR